MILNKIPASGKIGFPSKIIEVQDLIRLPYTMHVWPNIHQKSAAAKI
jgi:hypothetical protein